MLPPMRPARRRDRFLLLEELGKGVFFHLAR